ncbi:MAG: hypothetical protein JOZ90_01040 [Alphaproteobacteria bacterium]|nr:hypothetical protein [Alphaproteobacteria bacterium]MBV9370873.1 hypothetical protein [Alphaproteobacteria bacterium]MBV9899663.1 hypothetical protein [Alphaproteobacteria bacterium]
MAGLIAAAAILGPPARAGMPVEAQMKCPIGGKSFTYTTTASYSTWGTRPDGKPYGSWDFPLELPRCPGNGLVVFDRFTAEEVKRLEPLVASAEYRAMLDKETNYYLAAWLMKRLGRPDIDVAWMIVQASWQADARPELKARYQTEYVALIRALPRAGDAGDWLAMQGRAANGLRELKRFEEAKALLAGLDLSPLNVPVPEEKVGATTPSGLGHQVLNFEEIQEAKRKRAFLGYFEALKDLIDRRDARSEPLRLIPVEEAARRCRAGGDLSADDKEYCASGRPGGVAPERGLNPSRPRDSLSGPKADICRTRPSRPASVAASPKASLRGFGRCASIGSWRVSAASPA